MNMKVCVSCQQDVSAKKAMPVKEDRIIKGIRAAKKLLRIAQMNELFVCEECMQKHLERRRSFEKTVLFASVFAGALFILALPVFKYAPAVEGVSANAFKMAAKPAAAPSATPAQPAGEAQKKRKKKK